jgi:hypothetical protein
MSPARTSKTIADRVDLGFHRQGNRMRRWRWRAGLLALAAALALPAWAALSNHEAIYQAGPLSEAHQLIANDCRRCHTTTWEPALRLARLDDRHVSVADEACTVCHAGPPHHSNQLPADASCANCHREHRGRDRLARTADIRCTQCHASLQTTNGPSTQFAQSIWGFARHPQFAVKRSLADPAPGAEHLVHKVAEISQGNWRDRATLRFNHRKHAGPDGLLRLDGTRQALRCEDCHQLNRNSGSILPIHHEQHCAACHGNQLHFDEAGFPKTKVMHGPVANIRAELLERYASLASRQPEHTHDQPQPAAEREVPGRQPKLSQSVWTWANEQLDAALDQLLNRNNLGCRYCHIDVRSEGDDPNDWTVGDPRIPSRWLGHSVFRHDRHQLLRCTECHEEAVTSSQTADILLPGIELCRRCHGLEQKGGGARSDCVECHVYHHGEGTADGPLSLDLLLVRPDNVRQPPRAEDRPGAAM